MGAALGARSDDGQRAEGPSQALSCERDAVQFVVWWGRFAWSAAVGWGVLDVELLYFEGCPSWERAWTELRRAMAELDLDVRVRLRDIGELEESEKVGFAGSPTIRINGRDLEGYAGPAVLACRRYPDNDGHGWPSRPLLFERLRAAAEEA